MRRSRSAFLGVLGLMGMGLLAGCADGADSGTTGRTAAAGAMGPTATPRTQVSSGASSGAQAGSTAGANTSPSGAAPTPTTDAASKDATSMDSTVQGATQTAMFGAGCFWGVQAKFDKIDGVIATEVGYAGGTMDKPTYKDVCTDETGHAEVVHITFDPAKVSYQQLVDAFFTLHDPTQMNRQGPDYGTQYRTVIFYYSPEQQQTAEATIQRLTEAKKFPRPIVTKVVPAAEFWKAEDYHQKYLKKRGLDDCHL